MFLLWICMKFFFFFYVFIFQHSQLQDIQSLYFSIFAGPDRLPSAQCAISSTSNLNQISSETSMSPLSITPKFDSTLSYSSTPLTPHVLLIENASTREQILPLIPKHSDTVVFISSRRHIQLQGMQTDISFPVFELRLAPLSHSDAVKLVQLYVSKSKVCYDFDF
jgi:hypothetical protein